jgi:hypothetical protein
MVTRQQSSRKNRPYRVKKTGAKDENVDRQITAIHKAIAIKLLQDHQIGKNEYIDQVFATLEVRRDEGRMGYGEFLTWWSMLEMIEQPEVFLNAMIEDSARMRKLRRRTPFVGILTEPERQAALEADSIGELPNLKGLL